MPGLSLLLAPQPEQCSLRLSRIRRATVVMSRAERYREFARECLRLANLLPPGPQRDRVRDMAYGWARLAEGEDGIAGESEDDEE